MKFELFKDMGIWFTTSSCLTEKILINLIWNKQINKTEYLCFGIFQLQI